MPEEERIQALERQISLLEEERRAAIAALEAASEYGTYEPALFRHEEPTAIMEETSRRIGGLINFRILAFFLINEDDADFTLALCDPPEKATSIQNELAPLVRDKTFALALARGKPTFAAGSDPTARILLQSLSTPSRVRGMLAGIMDREDEDISYITMSLFSVATQGCAYALESFELYRQFRDLSASLERKVEKRTRDLRESEERFRVISDAALDAILMISERDEIVYQNPAARELLGYSFEEISRIRGQQILRSEDGSILAMVPWAEGGKWLEGGCLMELTVKKRNGVILPVEASLSVFSIRGVVHCVALLRDISARKNFESLKSDVERITRHDLKAPLNGLIGIPDVMLMDDNLTREQRHLLEGMRDTGFKMLKMINLSLDLYKMEVGSYRLVPSEVDLLKTLRTIDGELKAHRVARSVTFRFLVDGREVEPGDTYVIPGEELLCYSMLSNLVKNALEASPEHEVVTVSMGEEDGMHRIDIHNLGAVPENVRDTFFEKYATSGKTDGTGLGTYSARLIAETHHGRISFSTDEEAGTTVTLRLPREPHSRTD